MCLRLPSSIVALSLTVGLVACGPGESDSTTSATARLHASSTTSVATSEPSTVSVPGVGAGSLVYSSALEPAEPFSAPYGIDVGPSGSIYVFDTGNNRVVVFDSSGEQTAEWGGAGSEEGQFDTLGFGALAVDGEGDVFVVDNGNHRIQKFDGKGEYLSSFGVEGEGEGGFRRAIGIAVEGNQVFVSDDEVPFVQVFDLEGNYLREFGGPGDRVGTFRHATGIDVATDGDVYVADYEKQTVQRFDPEGVVTGLWKNPGPAGSFQTPEGILVLDNDQILVTSYREGEVQLLPDDATDDVAWVVAVESRVSDDRRLVTPVDLAERSDGAICVTDQTANTVLCFRRT